MKDSGKKILPEAFALGRSGQALFPSALTIM